MTKAVRIENADTSIFYAVHVQTWQKGSGGFSDFMLHEETLEYPTALNTFLIHEGRYLVIKEKSRS